MQQTKYNLCTPPFYASDEGEICFTFQHVLVQVSYAQQDSACLKAQNHFWPGTAGYLAEVSVWQNTQNSIGEAYGVDSFPFSPRGFPLGFATVEQVAAILHWASLLQSYPPIPAYEQK